MVSLLCWKSSKATTDRLTGNQDFLASPLPNTLGETLPTYSLKIHNSINFGATAQKFMTLLVNFFSSHVDKLSMLMK